MRMLAYPTAMHEDAATRTIVFDCRYAVTTKTGTQTGASTTANVSLFVSVGGGDLQEIELAKGKDDFARGKLQTFEAFIEGTGAISAVWLGHDGFGARLLVICLHMSRKYFSATLLRSGGSHALLHNYILLCVCQFQRALNLCRLLLLHVDARSVQYAACSCWHRIGFCQKRSALQRIQSVYPAAEHPLSAERRSSTA